MAEINKAHSDRPPSLVFDLGGTNIRVAIADSITGKLLDEERRLTCNFLSHPHLDAHALLKETLARMESAANILLKGATPSSIVCGWPGPARPDGLVLRSPTILGQALDIPFNVRQALAKIWPRTAISVHNELTCAGYAYVGAGMKDFCIFTVGSGIANKVFVDGKPVLGRGGRGGEAGHIAAWLPSDFPFDATSPSIHLGDLASGRGTFALATQLASQRANDPTFSKLSDNEELVAAFHRRDPFARYVIGLVAQPLAHMIAAIHGTVGTEQFAITGGFAVALGEPYRQLLVKNVSGMVWDLGMDWNKAITLGEEADGLKGAAFYATLALSENRLETNTKK